MTRCRELGEMALCQPTNVRPIGQPDRQRERHRQRFRHRLRIGDMKVCEGITEIESWILRAAELA